MSLIDGVNRYSFGYSCKTDPTVLEDLAKTLTIDLKNSINFDDLSECADDLPDASHQVFRIFAILRNSKTDDFLGLSELRNLDKKELVDISCAHVVINDPSIDAYTENTQGVRDRVSLVLEKIFLQDHKFRSSLQKEESNVIQIYILNSVLDHDLTADDILLFIETGWRVGRIPSIREKEIMLNLVNNTTGETE